MQKEVTMLIDTQKGHIPYHRIISMEDDVVTYETAGGREIAARLNDRGISQMAGIGRQWIEVLDVQNEVRLVPIARITSLAYRPQGSRVFYEVNTAEGEVYYADKATWNALIEGAIEVFDFGDVP
jgi:uncharacterized protein YtpQ (UPF0354 family)